MFILMILNYEKHSENTLLCSKTHDPAGQGQWKELIKMLTLQIDSQVDDPMSTPMSLKAFG